MTLQRLREQVTGDVFTPLDAGFGSALQGFNTALTHAPDLIVVPHCSADVACAVAYARGAAMRVTAHATGHGDRSATGGVLIATHQLDVVQVNPISRIAVIGAGARWQHVVDEAAKYGLTPVAGSSPQVGVVGFLLGGGLGPLARSHGFSSDYVTEFKVVTGSGDAVIANSDTNTELFWALRGGKTGLGVITEVTLRVVAIKELYAGSLTFAEEDIAHVLRSWIRWSHTAHPMVTTSAAIARFPNSDAVPADLRGQHVISVRFAYPGDAEFGAELAAPLRALASPMIDTVGPLPAKDMGQIHNDPTHPMPVWMTGMLLDHADDDCADAILDVFGSGTNSPFFGVELRHIGHATSSDVTEGSAVAGRSATYVMSAGAVDPTLFKTVMPKHGAQLAARLKPWRAREGNPNFTGLAESHDAFMQLWPIGMRARIEAVRRRHDKKGMFAVTV